GVGFVAWADPTAARPVDSPVLLSRGCISLAADEVCASANVPLSRNALATRRVQRFGSNFMCILSVPSRLSYNSRRQIRDEGIVVQSW
ncbi:MAG: hypothetical protein ABI164_04300, partial [Acidobacteriaceae bacterium]